MLSKFSSMKKSFCYTFFPTKEEEESGRRTHCRTMVEIRDIYSPPVSNPDHPWKIKLTLSQYEVDSKKLVLSWHDTFEHVLRYWPLDQARAVDLGLPTVVGFRDVSDDGGHGMYGVAYLQKGEGDEFHLTCMEFMMDKRMQVNDVVLLYWDFDKSCFVFKPISSYGLLERDLNHLKLDK